MPKIRPLTSREVIELLEKNGFILDRTRGSHMIFFNPSTRRMAVVPLHKKDLPIGTLIEILRQADISRDELR